MSNDANNGYFRRLYNTLLETDSDILQTLSTHEVLNFDEILGAFLSGPSLPAGLTKRVNPNLANIFKVDKQTTLVSQCTCPLFRHTPLFAVDDGEPAADLWFRLCCVWSI